MFKGIFLVGFLILFLGACVPATGENPPGSDPTPTVHAFFEPKTPVPPFATAEPDLLVPSPTPEGMLTSGSPVLINSLVLTATIFDDQLNNDWKLEASPKMTFETEDAPVVHSGNSALTLNGQPGAELSFRIKANAETVFESIQTFGLSFWVYSGRSGLLYDDLLVQLFGSNEVYYWAESDQSVWSDLETFSGEMLYGLGLNRDIPRNSWQKIEILFDNLVYDPNLDDSLIEFPDFAYVTGFSIIFAEGFRGTIWVDDVHLLMLEPE